MADVRQYAGVPPVAAFADMGAPFPGGTPVVVDSTTGNAYVLIAGVVTQIKAAAPTGAALTRVDDTNVTLTLGGSPTTALLAATSLTLGWTGTLAASRGGNPALSCGFMAYKSASTLNQTGAGTVYTLGADTEVFDVGSNYNSTTFTFTAPATGTYQFNAAIGAFGITAAADDYQLSIVTTAFTSRKRWNLTNTLPSILIDTMSCYVAMTANDTCSCQFYVSGEAGDVVDIAGDNTGTSATWFSGYRVT